jgi:hypothetical protein
MGNPFTRPTTTNPFQARAVALEGFSDTASTTETIISQPTSSREEIARQFKTLTKEDCEEFLNNMISTEDF